MLAAELERARIEYTTVRPHAAIGHVTPTQSATRRSRLRGPSSVVGDAVVGVCHSIGFDVDDSNNGETESVMKFVLY